MGFIFQSIFFLAVIGGLGYLALRCFKWFKKEESIANDPHNKMQKIIERETDKLAASQEALLASERYVRQIQRETDMCRADVMELKAKVKGYLGDGQTERAKSITAILIKKETDQAVKENQLDASKERHQKNIDIVATFQKRIKDLRREAKDLKISESLATAEQHAAALAVDLDTDVDNTGYDAAKGRIQETIDQAQAKAQVDSDMLKSDEDKWLDNTDQSVEERLKQIQSE